MTQHNPATLDEMFAAIETLPPEHFEPGGERPDDATVAIIREAARLAELQGWDALSIVTDGDGGIVMRLGYAGYVVEVGAENSGVDFVVTFDDRSFPIHPRLFYSWIGLLRAGLGWL